MVRKNVTITILGKLFHRSQQVSRLASQTKLRPAFSGSPPMTGFRRRTQLSMPTVLVKCGDFDPIPLCSANAWKIRCSVEPLHHIFSSIIHRYPAKCNKQFDGCMQKADPKGRPRAYGVSERRRSVRWLAHGWAHWIGSDTIENSHRLNRISAGKNRAFIIQ